MVKICVDSIVGGSIHECRWQDGGEVCMVVNGLGGVTDLEMGVAAGDAVAAVHRWAGCNALVLIIHVSVKYICLILKPHDLSFIEQYFQ